MLLVFDLRKNNGKFIATTLFKVVNVFYVFIKNVSKLIGEFLISFNVAKCVFKEFSVLGKWSADVPLRDNVNKVLKKSITNVFNLFLEDLPLFVVSRVSLWVQSRAQSGLNVLNLCRKSHRSCRNDDKENDNNIKVDVPVDVKGNLEVQIEIGIAEGLLLNNVIRGQKQLVTLMLMLMLMLMLLSIIKVSKTGYVNLGLNMSALMQFVFCEPNPHVERLLQQSNDVERNPGPVSTPETDVGSSSGEGRAVHHEAVEDTRGSRDAVADLQVTTLNVRGLGDKKKVRHLVNSCYKRSRSAKDNFFMFQETYVPMLKILDYIWRGDYYLTPGTGNSLGCVTLISPPYKIVQSRNIDQRGHVLALTKSNVNKIECILVNIYAPNGFDDAKLKFFEDVNEALCEMIIETECNEVILAGDLNLVFKASEVANRNISAAEVRIASAVKELFNNLRLTDGWENNGGTNFTWSTNRTGTQAFSTLDRICFTNAGLVLIEKKADWSMSISDHAAVVAKFNKAVKASNVSTIISRLDQRLLQDEAGRTILKEVFENLRDQSDATWSPHVRLEYYKMCIRTAANTATGKIKAQFRDEEASINEDINRLVNDLADEGTPTELKTLIIHKLEDLRHLKRMLVAKIGTRLEQRTARKWYNEGELNNKYFFNILNRRTNDEINVIVNDDGQEVTDPEEVEKKIVGFYRNLYETTEDGEVSSNELFDNIDPLDPEQAASVVDELTVEDLSKTLETCQDSAPGPDGIPYSFLKFFWSDYGPVLLNAWKFSLRTGELPPSHKTSYLRLIPKAGKDPKLITNLRPITLSNTDHKLVTKTYSRKLTSAVSACIGEEQTAYIPGRLINDNVRSMLMTVDLANRDQDVDGVLVSLDAKKAFDSVNHRYIEKCLEAFGLHSFIPIFRILYKGLKSDIILNGKIINGYRILKGVKQGDALSCILFIMCIEPLIRNIKRNEEIRPLRSNFLRISIPKIYGFADDVNVLTKRSGNCLQAIFNEYERFSEISGLVLNAEKTEILCFNNRRENDRFGVHYRGKMYNLESQDQIKINGIIFSQDETRREEVNVRKVLDSMDRLLRMWSTRHLTLLGRILILKTFAISQLIYLCQTLTLGEASRRAAIKIMFKYLWNRHYDAARAPERIKRSIMLTPLRWGGFGLVDINELCDSLDLRSYGRLIISKHPFLAQLANLINDDDFFNARVDAPVDAKLIKSLKLLNKDRQQLLNWPIEIASSNAQLVNVLGNSKLKNFLTPAGRQGLNYFALHQRKPNAKLSQVTLREFDSIARSIKYKELVPIVRLMLTRGVLTTSVAGISGKYLYPTHKDNNLVNVMGISSKTFRLNNQSADKIICLYKQGLALTPGEVLSWTKRVKRLTSTRHKNLILRVAHGDIFSSERLCRFGLVNDPKCNNCNHPVEDVRHKLVDCPSAVEAWEKLDEVKSRLGLETMGDRSLEGLLGTTEPLGKLELTLNAELLHRLASSKKYVPMQLVNSVVKFISSCETLGTEISNKFKEIIRES